MLKVEEAGAHDHCYSVDSILLYTLTRSMYPLTVEPQVAAGVHCKEARVWFT